MLRSRRMVSTPQAMPDPAATARSRLLCDNTIRHTLNRTAYLSPAEQRQQAVQIAHSFTHHYLAKLTYLDDCQTTIAMIRPIDTRQPACQIWVDAIGNVSVCPQHLPSTTAHPFSRALFIPGFLLVALGILFLVVFI